MWNWLVIDIDLFSVILSLKEIEYWLQQEKLVFSELENSLATIISQYRVDGHFLWLESVLDHLVALAQIVNIQLGVGLVDSIERLILFESSGLVVSHFEDFCWPLDLLAECVVVARVRHLDYPFKTNCTTEVSLHEVSQVDAWIDNTIDVDDLVCRLKFFDGWCVFLLQVQEENSVAHRHLKQVLILAQLLITELIMACKGIHSHQWIEVTDIDHVTSCLSSLQLLERHLAEVVCGLTLQIFVELALDVKNVHIRAITKAKIVAAQN